MPASLSRYVRQNRSYVNKAANRVMRDAAAFNVALNCISRLIRRREQELGRDLLPDEVESLCELVVFDDVVEFIRLQSGGDSC
jgi:hypothetical protein